MYWQVTATRPEKTMTFGVTADNRKEAENTARDIITSPDYLIHVDLIVTPADRVTRGETHPARDGKRKA